MIFHGFIKEIKVHDYPHTNPCQMYQTLHFCDVLFVHHFIKLSQQLEGADTVGFHFAGEVGKFPKVKVTQLLASPFLRLLTRTMSKSSSRH